MLTRDQLLEIDYYLRLTRTLEERLVALFRQAKVIGGLYRSLGQEGESVAAAYALDYKQGDVVQPLIRNLGSILVAGAKPVDVIKQYMAKGDSPTRGRELNIHFGDPARDGFIGQISMLGDMIPVMAGIALAGRMQKKNLVTLAFIGDGGSSTGAFWEGFNFATVQRLPMVIVVENNAYAYSTPTSKQTAAKTLADKAVGVGAESETVDGNDVLAVYDATKRAVERARAGGGVTLLEVLTFRLKGHAEHDNQSYVPQEVIDEWRGKDAVERFERRLLDDGVASEEDLAAIKQRVRAEVDAATDEAEKAPMPDGSEAAVGLFTLSRAEGTGSSERSRQIVISRDGSDDPVAARRDKANETTYIEAITQAMAEEMARDERVFLIGEDVGVYGGAFGTSKGLIDRFGSERVVDTPISEMAIVGAASGAALMGMRPIAEMQFIDFITCAYDMLVNFTATNRYLYNRACPIVVRGPAGGGVHGGPFHSLNPEAMFMNRPGLKIVSPGTAYDAKGLLKAAIRDDDPVLFIEHKYLYRRIKEELPAEDYVVPIGKANVRRRGKDLTIITWSAMLYVAEEAADALSKDGVSVEIIDLRSIIPFDEEAILESVSKTNRVIILHEAPLTGGAGAEFAARIAEKAFDYLDAPIKRVAALDVPLPYSPPLEAFVLPNRDKVIAAARELLSY